MSQPLEERLSRFTPDVGGFDRDGLLFAAGRASARPNRKWIALVCGLAASQLVTLTLLLPRSAPPVSIPDSPTIAELPIEPSRPAEPSELWSLTQKFHASGDDLPPLTPGDGNVATVPPMRAFGYPSSWQN